MKDYHGKVVEGWLAFLTTGEKNKEDTWTRKFFKLTGASLVAVHHRYDRSLCVFLMITICLYGLTWHSVWCT